LNFIWEKITEWLKGLLISGITSNLTGDELKNPKNIAEQRVFNRILERCHPILVDGPDRRRKNIVAGFSEVHELLGL